MKFEEELKNTKEVYPVRISLTKGSFDDIYSLIVDKCSDAIGLK